MKDGLKLGPAVLGRHVLGLCDEQNSDKTEMPKNENLWTGGKNYEVKIKVESTNISYLPIVSKRGRLVIRGRLMTKQQPVNNIRNAFRFRCKTFQHHTHCKFPIPVIWKCVWIIHLIKPISENRGIDTGAHTHTHAHTHYHSLKMVWVQMASPLLSLVRTAYLFPDVNGIRCFLSV